MDSRLLNLLARSQIVFGTAGLIVYGSFAAFGIQKQFLWQATAMGLFFAARLQAGRLLLKGKRAGFLLSIIVQGMQIGHRLSFWPFWLVAGPYIHVGHTSLGNGLVLGVGVVASFDSTPNSGLTFEFGLGSLAGPRGPSYYGINLLAMVLVGFLLDSLQNRSTTRHVESAPGAGPTQTSF